MLRMRFSKSSMRFCERSMRVAMKELWELLREKYESVQREACEREKMVWNLWVVQITCEREKRFGICLESRQTHAGQIWQPSQQTWPGQTDGKWPGLTTLKIESLRLNFPFGKPSLRDSIFLAYCQYDQA